VLDIKLTNGFQFQSTENITQIDEKNNNQNGSIQLTKALIKREKPI